MGVIKSKYEAHKLARDTCRNRPDINDPASMKRHRDRTEHVARKNMTSAQRTHWDNHKKAFDDSNREFDQQWNA